MTLGDVSAVFRIPASAIPVTLASDPATGTVNEGTTRGTSEDAGGTFSDDQTGVITQ